MGHRGSTAALARRSLVGVLTSGALLCAATEVSADYEPTHIRWSGWSVASSENLYAGRTKAGRPLMLMVDGDPGTAWVFGGTTKVKEGHGREPYHWHTAHALRVEADHRPQIDRVRLRFGGASRARVVSVWINDRRIKEVSLPAKAGWHRIALPRTAIERLQLDFAAIEGGPLAIAELTLLDGAKAIPWNLPRAVIATNGDSCGCGTTLQAVRRDGRVLATDRGGEGGAVATSADGRFIAGTDYRPKALYLWVVDVNAGKRLGRWLVRRDRSPGKDRALWTNEVVFVGKRRVRVHVQGGPEGKPATISF